MPVDICLPNHLHLEAAIQATEEDIPVLLEIPDDRRVAEAYSEGILAITAVPEMYELFHRLYLDLCARCGGGVT